MNDLISILTKYPHIKNKIFVLIKWFIFPFKQMEKYLPDKGEIVDIGCGEGVFSIYLSLKSKKREVYGIDTDKKRIDLAQKAAIGITNLKFLVANALVWEKNVAAIAVSDVFHHFSLTDQEKFLKKTYSLLNKSGCLIIKEINKNDIFRAKLSRLWDLILYPKDKINYWATNDLVKKLKKLGFKVIVKRASFFFPGSTVIYICSKH